MDIKKQSVGTEDFEKNILSKAVYIDKTSYLTELYGEHVHSNGMSYVYDVLLFTRPRRFGKTLTMSMIKNFFELNYADPEDKSKPKQLFHNLAISRNKAFCEKYMGQFPVISLSLKGIEGRSYEKALQKFLQKIGDLYRMYRPVFEGSDKQYKEDMKFFNEVLSLSNSTNLVLSDEDIKTNIENTIITSLYKLTAMLNTEYEKKTIVIVDEYDVPLQKAAVGGYYDEMIDVVRGLFEKVFKTNDYLEKGFVTGCLRISHESIFTGINNFSIYTVNDEAYNTFIGFTREETVELLNKQKLSSKEETVMKWYNGYNFAGAKMLCPWSVLKFCESAGKSENLNELIPDNYWINTSGNDIVDICLKHPDAKDSMRLQNLLNGNSEIIQASEFTSYPEINTGTDFETMMSMMLHTGYLTVVKTHTDRSLEVKIPNEEVLDSFRERIKVVFSKKNAPWFEKAEALKNALFDNNKDKVQLLINELLINFVSVRDSSYENFYHGFLLGVLSMVTQNASEISSNKENGKGFSDLILRSGFKAVILEFKKMPSDSVPKALLNTCTEALEQIEENKYDYNLQQDGYTQIRKFGITFYGKECVVLNA
ncbi:AAA family ATPase [uncultured Succinivibrio sp.]|uniref:AAA family ATPase n=1 Tax=uncultured Succinivibrio sp. TaxID=540749 RepID=UPI0025F292FE|nr:AAA family ATPase [uncultured Succinivibrio sp.]